MISIEKVDESFIKIQCEDDIAKELSLFFTFKVPNHEYTPAFRKKKWDGKIRLFNLASRTIYTGLLDYIHKFLNDRNYHFKSYSEELIYDELTVRDWINKQKIFSNKKQLHPHDYQIDAVVNALCKQRLLLISPTGSGKSLIIYLIIKFLLEKENKKQLIVVPTTGLVNQMYYDFADYSNKDPSFLQKIHVLFSGKEKNTSKKITISTWQSIFRENETYFNEFFTIIGDECHLFKAKSLVSLVRKMKNTKFRIGTTGTLDNAQAHKLIIEGLFGRSHVVTTTKDLIDDDVLSQLNIKCLLLNYSTHPNKLKYADEIDWLITNSQRNQFIADLANNLDGNVLVLFNYVERHGLPLYQLIKNKKKKDVFQIHGKTDTDERELIRNIVNEHKNSVLVASYGTCSTGINIKNINAIIFASPSKSVVRVLQSIGRGLRKSDRKTKVTVYDIGDNLKHKSYRNHTLRHMDERITIYTNERFNYKIFNIRLGES